jgi:16S rRNA (cytosine967-C5)-methyltransferase
VTAPEPGLAAREAALAIVEAALARRTGLDEGLSAPGVAGLEPRERSFARMLALTTLRRLGQIDRALAGRLQRPPPEAVTALLRIGLAQALFMDTPDHAAVATTLSLAERRKETRAFKGLINGVLRGLLREPPVLEPEQLAPDWLYARWRAAYGEAARELAAAIAEEPATDLTLRDPADAEALASLLEAEVLPGGSLRTSRRGDVSEWPAYGEGRWWVQDAAAAVPARLLAVQPGETALDLCAAPGGKTLQLAAAGAVVTAVDRSAARLRRLADNLARTGLLAEVVTADIASWTDERQFDAVLLDAPCTSTGTFRRHPDVLWATRPGDIATLAQVQTRLLAAAARRVKPGGRLVYCVCSLELEEGEAQAQLFLKRNRDFELTPIAPGEGGAPMDSVMAGGMLRILPQHLPGGADGFFAARFHRLHREATQG